MILGLLKTHCTIAVRGSTRYYPGSPGSRHYCLSHFLPAAAWQQHSCCIAQAVQQRATTTILHSLCLRGFLGWHLNMLIMSFLCPAPGLRPQGACGMKQSGIAVMHWMMHAKLPVACFRLLEHWLLLMFLIFHFYIVLDSEGVPS